MSASPLLACRRETRTRHCTLVQCNVVQTVRMISYLYGKMYCGRLQMYMILGSNSCYMCHTTDTQTTVANCVLYNSNIFVHRISLIHPLHRLVTNDFTAQHICFRAIYQSQTQLEKMTPPSYCHTTPASVRIPRNNKNAYFESLFYKIAMTPC